jgi:hypothetical protein
MPHLLLSCMARGESFNIVGTANQSPRHTLLPSTDVRISQHVTRIPGTTFSLLFCLFERLKHGDRMMGACTPTALPNKLYGSEA